MPLNIKPSSGSGSITLAATTGTSTNDTLTLPAKTGNIITSADSGTVTQAMLSSGVTGNGPTFIAYQNSTQSVSTSTYTKISLQAELYDTANCFDPTTNYRFTPNVAGFYQVNGQVRVGAMSGNLASIIYRNNTAFQSNSVVGNGTNSTASLTSNIVYLNGSTDYIELYVWQNSGSSQTTQINFAGTNDATWFSASLVRSA